MLVTWHLARLTSCPSYINKLLLISLHSRSNTKSYRLAFASGFDVCVSEFICLHTPSCGSANTNGRLMWLALPLLDMHSSETAG